MDISSYPAPDLSDFTIDWSALTQDIFGDPVVPGEDIDMAAVVAFRYLSEEDIESGEPYISWGHELFVFAEVTGTTSVKLSDLTMFGTDIDVETYFEASHGTWLLMLSTGDIPGAGVRMMAFLTPTAGESTPDPHITNDSTVFDWTNDLGAELAVPAGEPFIVDWSGLTKVADGGALAAGDVDTVVVGWVDVPLADLEHELLDIGFEWDASWTGAVDGESLDLALLVDDDGGAFGGIGEDGVWVLGLYDSEAVGPVPLFLTVLVPRG